MPSEPGGMPSLRLLQARPRQLLGRPMPCVGRDSVLTMLQGILGECRTLSRARAVLITAPAGIGKSRVCHELLARVVAQEVPIKVWIARGQATHAGAPNELLRQLLWSAVDAGVGDRRDVVRERLVRRAGELFDAAEAQRISTFLCEAAGAGVAADEDESLQSARSDPRVMGDQVRYAWQELVRAELTRRPLLLVIEDLHWGDLASAQAIDTLLRGLGNAPLMVLASARPGVDELFPQLWDGQEMLTVRLPPLTQRAARRLVREALGASIDDAAVEHIVSACEGNAFYLEETIRGLATSGPTDAPAPSIGAMSESRIASLGPDVQRVLRAASVFGETFTRAEVEAITRHPVEREISELIRDEVIEPTATGVPSPQGPLRFRHALVRDAAYASFEDDERRLAHRLAGEHLQGRFDCPPFRIAQHFDQGGEAAKAARHYLRSAAKALQGSDFVATQRQAERAMECDPALRGVGLRYIAEAKTWQAEFREGAECALEALELIEEGSDAWYRTAMTALIAAQRAWPGSTVRLVEIAERARRPIPEPGARSARVMVLVRAACRLFFMGRPDLLDSLLVDAERHLDGSLRDESTTKAWLRVAEAMRAFQAQKLDRYLRIQAEAADILEKAGQHREALAQRDDVAWWSLLSGKNESAAVLGMRIIADAERLGARRVAASSAELVLMAHVNREAWGEVLGHLDRFERAYGDVGGGLALRAWGCLAYLELNDFEICLESTRDALAKVTGAHPYATMVRAIEALALSALARVDEAVETIDAALAGGHARIRLGALEAIAHRADLSVAMDVRDARRCRRAMVRSVEFLAGLPSRYGWAARIAPGALLGFRQLDAALGDAAAWLEDHEVAPE